MFCSIVIREVGRGGGERCQLYSVDFALRALLDPSELG